MTQKFSMVKGTGRTQKIKILGVALIVGLLGFGIYQWMTPGTLAKPKSALSASYSDHYKSRITLKDGSTAYLVPVKNTQDHFKHLRDIHTDPSCAANMTDGKPWADRATKGNQMLYAFSWQLFHDLKRSGKTSTKPMTLAYLILDENGTLLGDVGIQKEKGERLDEVFFNTMPAARRKGVAYASGKHCIKFYEKHVGTQPMGANILPDNKASQNLMTKLGFKPLFDKNGKRDTTTTNGRLYELWKRPVAHTFPEDKS